MTKIKSTYGALIVAMAAVWFGWSARAAYVFLSNYAKSEVEVLIKPYSQCPMTLSWCIQSQNKGCPIHPIKIKAGARRVDASSQYPDIKQCGLQWVSMLLPGSEKTLVAAGGDWRDLSINEEIFDGTYLVQVFDTGYRVISSSTGAIRMMPENFVIPAGQRDEAQKELGLVFAKRASARS